MRERQEYALRYRRFSKAWQDYRLKTGDTRDANQLLGVDGADVVYMLFLQFDECWVRWNRNNPLRRGWIWGAYVPSGLPWAFKSIAIPGPMTWRDLLYQFYVERIASL